MWIPASFAGLATMDGLAKGAESSSTPAVGWNKGMLARLVPSARKAIREMSARLVPLVRKATRATLAPRERQGRKVPRVRKDLKDRLGVRVIIQMEEKPPARTAAWVIPMLSIWILSPITFPPFILMEQPEKLGLEQPIWKLTLLNLTTLLCV